MNYFSGMVGLCLAGWLFVGCNDEQVAGVVFADDSNRIVFAADKLKEHLKESGHDLILLPSISGHDMERQIIIGKSDDTSFVRAAALVGYKSTQHLQKEGFHIQSIGNSIVIEGSDESGVLYGCLELADRVKELGELPDSINKSDAPEMVMRGTCIGLQKTDYLPGRDVYEYPFTPDNFPWFYDKELWIRYLDMMVENRLNSLYLWNGHPFASLVRLPDYPYAVEVDSVTFAKNEEMYGFLTSEADKRGIYVVQMFYNIILSKPFAEYHGLETQQRSRGITPIISDYTRKSIAAFIEKYPNVGLLVCLGEAMNTVEDDVEWFTSTIIPGVKDGLLALGRTDEPPIILRGHDTNPQLVMDAALPIYHNLYTMQKYNGESLTTYEPRGPWTKIHQDLSSLGSVHVSNVHILANLEPFRYASPDFIQKAVVAMHKIHGANGLHLYPQASYWDWPYTADKTEPRLLQMDRDQFWYKAWARYAWNSKRDRNGELDYWSALWGDYYGCGENGRDILEAYEQTGEIAPKLLRRFGITDGNRQTLLLGMFMSQLINPHKWRVYSDFYESNGPKGEILIEFAKKEWEGIAHEGETPPQIIEQVIGHANQALAAIEKASPNITCNKDEFERLRNDVHCYSEISGFFSDKVNAAIWVLRYNYSKNHADLEKALPFLESSVRHYQKLVDLTKDKYLYANSMQTQQRRIPIPGTDGANKTWAELLPHYESELSNFKKNLDVLKKGGNASDQFNIDALRRADVDMISPEADWFELIPGAKVYTDEDYSIANIAEELKGLKGLRLHYKKQLEHGTSLHFRNDKPVKVVVGYFNGNSLRILNPPSLETDASANNRGQSDIRIANAMDVSGLFPVNIYTYYFEAGENELQLGKGIALILGFIDGSQEIKMRDAGIGVAEHYTSVDWLFY